MYALRKREPVCEAPHPSHEGRKDSLAAIAVQFLSQPSSTSFPASSKAFSSSSWPLVRSVGRLLDRRWRQHKEARARMERSNERHCFRARTGSCQSSGAILQDVGKALEEERISSSDRGRSNTSQSLSSEPGRRQYSVCLRFPYRRENALLSSSASPLLWPVPAGARLLVAFA